MLTHTAAFTAAIGTEQNRSDIRKCVYVCVERREAASRRRLDPDVRWTGRCVATCDTRRYPGNYGQTSEKICQTSTQESAGTAQQAHSVSLVSVNAVQWSNRCPCQWYVGPCHSGKWVPVIVISGSLSQWKVDPCQCYVDPCHSDKWVPVTVVSGSLSVLCGSLSQW
jgi:hypothetical protein